MKLILVILVSILLVSCLTSRKANKQLDKIENKFPEKIAEFARVKYPCIVSGIDTTYIYEDSTIYVQCPDEYVTVTDTVFAKGKITVRIDTIYKTKGSLIPVLLPANTIVINKKVKDSAEIKEAYIVRDAVIKDSAKAVSNLQRKVDRRTTYLWVLLATLGVSILINFIQSRRR